MCQCRSFSWRSNVAPRFSSQCCIIVSAQAHSPGGKLSCDGDSTCVRGFQSEKKPLKIDMLRNVWLPQLHVLAEKIQALPHHICTFFDRCKANGQNRERPAVQSITETSHPMPSSPTSTQTCRSYCCGCMYLCRKQSTLSNRLPFLEDLCSDHEDQCRSQHLHHCCHHSGNPGKRSSNRTPSGPSSDPCIECWSQASVKSKLLSLHASCKRSKAYKVNTKQKLKVSYQPMPTEPFVHRNSFILQPSSPNLCCASC